MASTRKRPAPASRKRRASIMQNEKSLPGDTARARDEAESEPGVLDTGTTDSTTVGGSRATGYREADGLSNADEISPAIREDSERGNRSVKR